MHILLIIEGFMSRAEISTKCDSYKLPTLSRCLLVIDLQFVDGFNILLMSSL